MVKPELGNKRVCVACGAHFYDLGRAPAVCPKCHTEQPAEQPRLRRPPGLPPDERRIKKPVPVPEDAALEVEEEAPEAGEEDVIEDTSDLGDDPDALGTDIEVGPGADDTES